MVLLLELQVSEYSYSFNSEFALDTDLIVVTFVFYEMNIA